MLSASRVTAKTAVSKTLMSRSDGVSSGHGSLDFVAGEVFDEEAFDTVSPSALGPRFLVSYGTCVFLDNDNDGAADVAFESEAGHDG